MDLADFQKAQTLISEKMSVQAALRILTEGGRIVGMTIGADQPAGGPMGVGVSVGTAYITYPPQMVDAIKQAFNDRLWAIGEELAKLGVTGM